MRFRAFNLCVVLPGILLLLFLAGAACQCTMLWSRGSTRCYFGWDNNECVAGYYHISGFQLPPVPFQFIPESAREYEDTPPTPDFASTSYVVCRVDRSSLPPRSAAMVFISTWEVLFLLLFPIVTFLSPEIYLNLRWDKRVRYWLCPRCGYEMIYSPERCPECGTVKGAVRQQRIPAYFRIKWFWVLLSGIILCLFVLSVYKSRINTANRNFFQALERDDYSRAISLLDRISSPNVCDATDFGKTPMEYAIEANQPELVKQLLLRHALTEHCLGMPSLDFAIQRDEAEIVTILLDAGESADKPVANFGTGLHVAVDSGHTSMVKLLLARGVSVSTQDGKGRTPLALAKEQLAEVTPFPLGGEKSVQNRREIVDLLKAAEITDATH